MVETVKDAGINWLQQFQRAWSQLLTWVNGVFTLVALYVMSDPTIHAKLLPFIPEEWRAVSAVALPMVTFWIVQKAKEIDRQRTIIQTRLHG
jgi:hypothetical protein